MSERGEEKQRINHVLRWDQQSLRTHPSTMYGEGGGTMLMHLSFIKVGPTKS